MNTSEHTSIWDSSSITCLPIFFSSSSGVIVLNPVHKMNIGLFFIGKRHVGNEFSLLTYHSTRWLLCWLSDALLAIYHVSTPTPAHTLNTSRASSSATAVHRAHVCVWHFWLRIHSGIKPWIIDFNSWDNLYVIWQSNLQIWPASRSSGQSFWLLITKSRVRFPALPWGFSLWGEDPRGDHGLGS